MITTWKFNYIVTKEGMKQMIRFDVATYERKYDCDCMRRTYKQNTLMYEKARNPPLPGRFSATMPAQGIKILTVGIL